MPPSRVQFDTNLVPFTSAASQQDKYGEVCPVNWKEGSKTMKADPKGSLEYFESSTANGHANGVEKRKRDQTE